MAIDPRGADLKRYLAEDPGGPVVMLASLPSVALTLEAIDQGLGLEALPPALPDLRLKRIEGQVRGIQRMVDAESVVDAQIGYEFQERSMLKGLSILAQAKADLAELLNLPSNYKILFLQGGATMHVSAVPMNLRRGRKAIDFVNTGNFFVTAPDQTKSFSDPSWEVGLEFDASDDLLLYAATVALAGVGTTAFLALNDDEPLCVVLAVLVSVIIGV